MYLFVYGSMKEGFRNHWRIASEELIGSNTITQNKYSMYPSNHYKFPYVIEKENLELIEGELYNINPEVFHTLDYFEGVPNFYYRKEIIVINNNKEYTAWIYFKSDENKRNHNEKELINNWTLELESKFKGLN